MDYKLYPHNQYAYEILKKSLEENQRACMVQPTGTGKAYITAEFLKENPTKNFLLLTSNNYIIDQFNEHFKKSFSNYKYIAYPTLLANSFKSLLKESFDYIVLDEFHRVGAELWGLKVQELFDKNSQAKIVGLTATHIRYLEEERNMTEELFNGNLVHNLTLMECFDTGILPRPKYISTIYNIDEEYESLIKKINKSKHQNKSQLRERIIEYRAKWEYSNGANIILKKHIKKERNFLIFCKDITHLEQMMPVVKNWFKIFQLPIQSFKVYSTHSDSIKELKEFKAAATNNLNSFNLLFSVQQLNEGLHVPNVEGVLFLRPTESHIIYYQQLGRSLETKGKQPIVFDMVNNFNKSKVHSIFNKTEYEPIFKNNYLKTDYDAYKFSFNIIDEVKDIQELFNKTSLLLKEGYVTGLKKLRSCINKFKNNEILDRDEHKFLSILRTGANKNKRFTKYYYPLELNSLAISEGEKVDFRYQCHIKINYANRSLNLLIINNKNKNWLDLPIKDRNKFASLSRGYHRGKEKRNYLDNIYYIYIFEKIKVVFKKDLLNLKRQKSFKENIDLIKKDLKAGKKILATNPGRKWLFYKKYHPETLNENEKKIVEKYLELIKS